jgi:hypothetical protein
MADDIDDLIHCSNCDSSLLVTDLVFPEPEVSANTQFSWLVATCPRCAADLHISQAVGAEALEP